MILYGNKEECFAGNDLSDSISRSNAKLLPSAQRDDQNGINRMELIQADKSSGVSIV